MAGKQAMGAAASGGGGGMYIVGIAIIVASVLLAVAIYSGGSSVQASLGKVGTGAPAVAPVGAQPPAVPPAAKATPKMTIISDARCTDCQTALLVQNLRELFPKGVEVKEYDYSEAEGKRLYQLTGVQYLPAVLFDDSVKSSEAYAQLSAYLDSVGGYQTLRIGATFDPTAEICGNGIDDDGNGKKDCEDAACERQSICMKKTDKPVVELFVVSHCPYGTQMEKGVLPVIDALGSKVDWNVRFIQSMHGQVEEDEQKLEYCMQKENKTRYFNYLACFLDKGNTSDCLARADVTKARYQQCINQTGYAPDRELSSKLGIQSSPTTMINGVIVGVYPRDPANVLKAVCNAFATPPAECSKNLSNQQYAAGFGFTFTQSGGGIASCGG
jgi:hypothetical protein